MCLFVIIECLCFWIVVGLNGCGKSIVYGYGDVVGFDGFVWIINLDLLIVWLKDVEKFDFILVNFVVV